MSSSTGAETPRWGCRSRRSRGSRRWSASIFRVGALPVRVRRRSSSSRSLEFFASSSPSAATTESSRSSGRSSPGAEGPNESDQIARAAQPAAAAADHQGGARAREHPPDAERCSGRRHEPAYAPPLPATAPPPPHMMRSRDPISHYRSPSGARGRRAHACVTGAARHATASHAHVPICYRYRGGATARPAAAAVWAGDDAEAAGARPRAARQVRLGFEDSDEDSGDEFDNDEAGDRKPIVGNYGKARNLKSINLGDGRKTKSGRRKTRALASHESVGAFSLSELMMTDAATARAARARAA